MDRLIAAYAPATPFANMASTACFRAALGDLVALKVDGTVLLKVEDIARFVRILNAGRANDRQIAEDAAAT